MSEIWDWIKKLRCNSGGFLLLTRFMWIEWCLGMCQGGRGVVGVNPSIFWDPICSSFEQISKTWSWRKDIWKNRKTTPKNSGKTPADVVDEFWRQNFKFFLKTKNRWIIAWYQFPGSNSNHFWMTFNVNCISNLKINQRSI